jgi:hypothetical protein
MKMGYQRRNNEILQKWRKRYIIWRNPEADGKIINCMNPSKICFEIPTVLGKSDGFALKYRAQARSETIFCFEVCQIGLMLGK